MGNWTVAPLHAASPTPSAAHRAQAVDDLLTAICHRLEPRLDGMVDALYEQLAKDPALLAVMQRLTPDELTHLKLRQADHVRLLLSPKVDAGAMHRRSRAVGRVHSMVGVEIDWYVDALTAHRNALLGALEEVGADLDLTLAQSVVTDRFMGDLHGQLLGMRDQDEAQSTVMLEILDAVAAARTVADLTRGVTEALGRLDGVAVCMFARQGPDGVMATESGSGPGFAAMTEEATRCPTPAVTTTSSEPGGKGPIGQAWRSGEIERCDSLLIDPDAEPWRELARRLGWGSSIAVPLVDRSGQARALLSLQAYWPGYFAAASRVAMFEQVKRITERALRDLKDTQTLASSVSAYNDRATHVDLLARGRVEMLFQPLVRLPGGELSKLEALARLRADDRLLSPAEFLPAFGDEELFALFHLGLRQALDGLRCWEAQGLHTGVSVNLPVVAADDHRYVQLVSQLLKQYAVEPSRLTLELLETGLADRELKKRCGSIEELKDLGVRLAQDDLGSGYSSLLRLRHFAFDDVKIDRGLVQGEDGLPNTALHFIKPINSIAHSLGLCVVIEGLEDEGLIEAAVQLGVDEGQGYGIARPMPAHEVVAWARGFRLDLDPTAPTTLVGALAGHVAWEHRLTAPGVEDARRVLAPLDTCAMTSYLRGRGIAAAVAAHEALHAAALRDRDSGARLAAWHQLVALGPPD